MFKSILVLTAICIIAALVLGVTYNITSPLIAAQTDKVQFLERVLPGADDYRKDVLGGREYCRGYQGGRLIGYVISAEGDGYSGRIEVLVGIDKTGEITGLEVLSQAETPGLGARCAEIKHGENEPWFLRQFKKKRASELDLKDMEAITGATITSEAILSGVKEAIVLFLERLKDKG